jgi:two-component system alkaline phosphatase synthesis response regulator PhoP
MPVHWQQGRTILLPLHNPSNPVQESELTMKRRVLLVEDEDLIALAVVDRLVEEEYEVEVSKDGQQGYEVALRVPFDLIILDVMLPRKTGLDICRDLRRQGVHTPILMLTARGTTADRIVGLKLGADDYLTKPFDFAELLARMQALLRRVAEPAPAQTAECQVGSARVDLRRAEVTREGQRMSLSPKEVRLLRYLLDHSYAVLSREELLKEVWGQTDQTSTRTVDVHIGWLRQKLEDDAKKPRLIETVARQGYRFNPG